MRFIVPNTLERTFSCLFYGFCHAVLKINAIYITLWVLQFLVFDRGVSSFYFHFSSMGFSQILCATQNWLTNQIKG